MVRFSLPLRRLLALVLTLVLILPAGLSVPLARALPSPPILLDPPEGELTTATNYPPTGTPTLSWAPVSKADMYTIQVCPSAGCSNPVLTQDTYSTHHTPLVALADGTWYWHVRAHDSTGWGDYSSPRSFTKSWLDNGALVPLLLLPPAPPDLGSTVEFFEYPIFSWTAVTGAAYYRLQIFNQVDCPGNPIYERSTIKNTFTPTARRSRGYYYWRVIPVDHRDHAGTASECRQFFMDYQQMPTLLSPADASIQGFTPELRWTAVKGARDYHLQVSTVQDFSTRVLDIWTTNTRYTPLVTLENDKEYYWRVAARDTANTEGPWNPALPNLRRFYMQWHLVGKLLSPTPDYISAPFPVFQWTPVAGAKKYHIQASINPSFNPIKWKADVVDPRYDHLDWGDIAVGSFYYWHVQAEDSSGNTAPWSLNGSFQFSWTPAATLIYPPYYYSPTQEPSTAPLDVRTDPTVPVPVFQWDRVVQQSPAQGASKPLIALVDGGAAPPGQAPDESVATQEADHYVIEVDDDQNFGSIDWTTRTENLSIAPSAAAPFAPTPGTIYYWRVQAYAGESPLGGYSEAWKARFDPALLVLTTTMRPYFPSDGMDSVYDTPLFGWSPLQGAAQYHFQISTADDFSSLAYDAHPTYSFYTPHERLAPETYYWRVRAQDSGGGYIGDWSAVRRIVVTYQLRWGDAVIPMPHPIHYDPYTRVGQDPAGDAAGGADYDLANLYLARDSLKWYLTLDELITSSLDMYFVYYVDLDHQAYSGGSTDPAGFNVQASSIYRPERVLVAHHTAAGEIDSVSLYRWQGTSWGPTEDLQIIGGGWTYEIYGKKRYLELSIPLNVFDLGETWLGTVSVEAFTAPYQGQAYDTVPAEPSVPTSALTNFTAAADKLNPLHPWFNPMINPFIQNQNPPLSFAKPLFRSYVRGFRIQVARDIAFTNVIRDEEWRSGSPPGYWFLGTRWTWVDTFEENNTLYWRVRIMHREGEGYGPWSQPVRFTKADYVPEQMKVEYDYATPTFRWDRVEGAAWYHIDVDDDAGFASLNIAKDTPNPSFTWDNALGDRTWNWRVSAYDGSARSSSYQVGKPFIKVSQAPTLTSPIEGVRVSEIPTLIWKDVLTPTEQAVVNSPKYRMVLDNDPNFSVPYIWQVDLDTTSTTPEWNLKLEDGTYYWQVTVLDTGGNAGPYSTVGVFYKAYLTPTLVSSAFDPSPNLTWAPLEEAAYYQVHVCRDPVYADCLETTVQTDQTNYVSPLKYLPGRYYWRVRMCDQARACGPWYQDEIGPTSLVFLPIVVNNKK